jgi:hypothetical protein
VKAASFAFQFPTTVLINECVIVDELHVDIMPVFLGNGLRSFEGSSLERVRIEKISVRQVGARTSLRFRVKQ